MITAYDCLTEKEKQADRDVVLEWHNSLDFYLNNDIADIVNRTMDLTIRLNTEMQKLGVSVKAIADDEEDQ